MYNRHHITKFLKLIFSACFILVLSACSSSDDTAATVEAVTEIPQFIQKLALITDGSLGAGITIDGGEPILMNLAGGTASAHITGLSRKVHTVQIIFIFTDGVAAIILATATGTVDLSSGYGSLSFADADYNVSYDEDNDGINNLTEIIDGTSPIDPVVAPVAYDFENGIVPATLSMSGNVAWAIDDGNGSGGSIRSLRSGIITDNQTSCVAITVTDSSNVSFDFMISSEADFDFLRFYIDNILHDEVSGSVDWTAVAYSLPTVGTYEYKWCYEKDELESIGSDVAWIDNLTIN